MKYPDWKKITKILMISCVFTVVCAYALTYLLYQTQKKTKAVDETVELAFSPVSTTSSQGQDFTTTVQVKPVAPLAVVGFEFTVRFDASLVEVKKIEYKGNYRMSTDLGQSDSDLLSVNQSGSIKIVGERPGGFDVIPPQSPDIITLTFQKKSGSTGSITVESGGSIYRSTTALMIDKVNATSAEFKLDNPPPAETNTPGSCTPLNGQCIGQEQCCSPLICFQAGIGGLCLEPTSTPPPTGACTTNPDSCSSEQACAGGTCGTPGCTIPTGNENVACYNISYANHDCVLTEKPNDTSCGDTKSCKDGVCAEQGTGTPPVSPSPASGVTLDLKLHFQGITGLPATDRNAMKVKFTVSGGGLAQSMVKTGDFISDKNGIWSGSINFPDLQAGTYTLFIKGPRHVQKKICDTAPNDQGAIGRYFCRAGSAGVALTMGANNLDFSNIWLLSGDLPLPGEGQDGIIDSKDISYIRNNLGVKTDMVCDINLDGICGGDDYTLLYKSLEVKYDEE